MTKKTIFFITFLFFSFSFFSQNNNQSNNYKIIECPKDRMIELPSIKSKDPVFKEYGYIVNDNYKAVSKKQKPELLFFKYTVNDNQTLLQIASRCNITYDTIASLNGLEDNEDQLKGRTLILPTCTGLFIIKDKPNTSIEILLYEAYSSKVPDNAVVYKIDQKEFFFIPNAKFSPIERAFFLDATLRLPLDKKDFWISSEFGKRKNPFSGELKNHNGIDLAANLGTPVYAIKDGDVAFCIEDDPTFGKYIMLSHDKGKLTSIYAHLSKIVVDQYKSVRKGDIIGYVGQTGKATGPHLHFEIRKNGVPVDPQKQLNLK